MEWLLMAGAGVIGVVLYLVFVVVADWVWRNL